MNEGYLSITVSMLEQMVKAFYARLPFILIGVVVFAAFYFSGRLVDHTLQRFGDRIRLDRMLGYLLGRLALGISLVTGFFAAAVVVFPSFKPADLLTGLGLTSVAIGFAFKDVLQNFFAGILILYRRPFRIGDQIRTLNHEGTVEEITIRATRLKTYEGERAILPNADVYTQSVLVRTAYPLRRIKIKVGIGYGDDLELARETLRETLLATDGVKQEPAPWIYVSELGDSAVVFSIYFWTESNQTNVLKVSDSVTSRIKLTLDAAGIDIPYPHSVVRLETSPSNHPSPSD